MSQVDKLYFLTIFIWIVITFVKEVDIKIYEKEKDFITFYDKYVTKEGIFLIIKNAYIYHLEKVITDEEYILVKNIGALLFMSNLELDINKKEWKEIIEKHNYIEVIKGLKEKGYLTEGIIKYLESLDN